MDGSLTYWNGGKPTIPDTGLGGLNYWIDGGPYVVSSGSESAGPTEIEASSEVSAGIGASVTATVTKSVSSTNDLALSESSAASIKKYLSVESQLSGGSETAVYLMSADLSITVEMAGAATANAFIRKSLSSAVGSTGSTTANSIIIKVASGVQGGGFGSTLNHVLNKSLSSQPSLSASGAANSILYIYIGSDGVMSGYTESMIDGGAAISLDFVYPLSVAIMQKQRGLIIYFIPRTAATQKNRRTVTIE
jgi:hypothetical protein